MKKILNMLEKDCKLTASQIASMLDMDEQQVVSAIHEFEEEGVILGYKAMIDWDKTDRESVTALIEIKVTPQRGQGFARIAERISQYSEVESCYLMSGGFDLAVLITGKSLKDVALFVAEKIAPLESVNATATHFVLRKFKDKGFLFSKSSNGQERIKLV
ncbi:MAG: Lrp/AsnC family transcriptional regulator [Clostridiales bacterium]|jgi:DNA-binding Lrp family transcriptional regulator|nr:Lrp/AsnC family transcriptional regulator [Clostridiales bacterium]